MAIDVFISYPHQDKAAADAACATLEASGIRCWIAPRDVPPGIEWAGAIVDAIDQCRAMVLIFSSSTNGSKQIHREVQRAFDREKPVVPFRIENVTPEKSLAYYMGPVHWLDALTPPLEQHLQKLATSVGALIGVSPSEGDVQEAQAEAERRARQERQRQEAETARRIEQEAGEKVVAADRHAAPEREQTDEPERPETEAWAAASSAGDAAALMAFLKEWPRSEHAKAARSRIKSLKAPLIRRRLILGLGSAGLVTLGGGAVWTLRPRLSAEQPPSSERAPSTEPAPGKDVSIRTFTGHADSVVSVAFSPDGHTALSASSDETLKLWVVATGREVRTFTGAGPGRSIAFSRDGGIALSANLAALQVWDVATGKELRTFFITQKHYVLSVAFSPDGRTAVSGDMDDNTLKLWDMATGKKLRTFFAGHSHWINSVAFSPDGRTALSGSSDKTLKLWDVATGKELRTFTGHSNAVFSVAFSPDGRTAVSGGSDQTLKLWDVATGKELRTFTGHSDSVNSVAFSPDGRAALSGSSDNTLKLWDVATGKELGSFAGHSGAVHSVAFSPDGRTALSGSKDHMMKLWDLAGL